MKQSENLIKEPDWQKVGGLVPVIMQDAKSCEVLTLSFMNGGALEKNLEYGKVVFYSRTKKRLWLKGEKSGNFSNIVDLGPDCDKDTLLVLVNSVGVTCHNGTISCFESVSKGGDYVFLLRLERLINTRKMADESNSYTASSFQSGTKRIAQKVGEEGAETALAAVAGDREELIREGADLPCHPSVLLSDKGLSLNDPITKLEERNKG